MELISLGLGRRQSNSFYAPVLVGDTMESGTEETGDLDDDEEYYQTKNGDDQLEFCIQDVGPSSMYLLHLRNPNFALS